VKIENLSAAKYMYSVNITICWILVQSHGMGRWSLRLLDSDTSRFHSNDRAQPAWNWRLTLLMRRSSSIAKCFQGPVSNSKITHRLLITTISQVRSPRDAFRIRSRLNSPGVGDRAKKEAILGDHAGTTERLFRGWRLSILLPTIQPVWLPISCSGATHLPIRPPPFSSPLDHRMPEASSQSVADWSCFYCGLYHRV
jgi:hypothetical protein